MDRLPLEVIANIVEFMDYNTRVAYNLAVCPEDRIYTKLPNPDAHNVSVKCNLLKHYMDKFNEVIVYDDETQYQQAIHLIHILKYLANTKDTVLFQYSTERFRSAMRENVRSHIEVIARFHKLPGRVRQDIQRLCERILQKLDTIPFVKEVEPMPIRFT